MTPPFALRMTCTSFLLLAFFGCANQSGRGGGGSNVASLEQKGVTVGRDLQGKVRSIRYNDRRPTDADFEELVSIGTVREVVAEAPDVTDSAFGVLARINDLEVLSITGSKTTGRGVADIAKLPKLKSLNLSRSQALKEELLEPLRENETIESLDLSHTPVTDVTVGLLTSLPNLTSLRITGTSITDAGIEELSKSDLKLTELALGSELISDTSIHAVLKFKDLRRLEITDSKITDEGAAQLSGLQSLELIRLGGNVQLTNAGILLLGDLPGLTQLDVSSTAFTGTDFNKSGFRKLTLLEANETQVTDDSLPDLKGVPHLYSLRLLGTTVTEKGVRKVFDPKHQTAVEFAAVEQK